MAVIKRTTEEWRSLLAEQQSSGQTQEEWCVAKGVNLYTMRDRARRIRRQDEKAASHAGLQSVDWLEVNPKTLMAAEAVGIPVSGVASCHEPVSTAAPSEKKSIDIRVTRGEWTIIVSAGFELKLLADVLRVVRQVCC